MKFNASDNPTKMGTFPQYDHPKALEKYASLGRYLGLSGKDDLEVFNKLIEKIKDLKKDIEVPSSIQEYGIKEEDFLKTLDEMSLAAFNDQCTVTNPRYPLVSEIKELYLEAYYGK